MKVKVKLLLKAKVKVMLKWKMKMKSMLKMTLNVTCARLYWCPAPSQAGTGQPHHTTPHHQREEGRQEREDGTGKRGEWPGQKHTTRERRRDEEREAGEEEEGEQDEE